MDFILQGTLASAFSDGGASSSGTDAPATAASDISHLVRKKVCTEQTRLM